MMKSNRMTTMSIACCILKLRITIMTSSLRNEAACLERNVASHHLAGTQPEMICRPKAVSTAQAITTNLGCPVVNQHRFY